jgi:putative phosphoribosyl transferase
MAESEIVGIPDNIKGGRLIQVSADVVRCDGLLHIPQEAHGLVMLPHGIHEDADASHQNALALASTFYNHGLATLLVDLFSSEEQRLDRETSFFRRNVDIMQQRIIGIANWLLDNEETQDLSIGYFGAGVMGAAVVIAAAQRPDVVNAVVSAGGDAVLSQANLEYVTAPTLLIAPEKDETAVKVNQEVLTKLKVEKQAEQVAGASSVFEDERATNEVTRLAGQWFARWLSTHAPIA